LVKLELVGMVDPSHEQAKRPVSAALAGPYGHPFHPILVTIPIGAWVGSLVFDIASHLVRDPDFLVRGAMWLIALGVIGALAAALVGFLDLFAIPPGTRAFRVGLIHMALNLLVTAAYAGNFLWRHTDHRLAAGVGGGMLALNAVSLVVLGAPAIWAESSPTATACGSPMRPPRPRASSPRTVRQAPPADHSPTSVATRRRGRGGYSLRNEETSWTSPH
jgi:uncharacterized membrane protein